MGSIVRPVVLQQMRSRFFHIIMHNDADSKFDCFVESARSILSDYKEYSNNKE